MVKEKVHYTTIRLTAKRMPCYSTCVALLLRASGTSGSIPKITLKILN